jgi:hypothetical protein
VIGFVRFKWLSYKAAYEDWLSSENLDNSGKQRRALGELLKRHR